MKKGLSIILVVAMVMGLTACGNKPAEAVSTVEGKTKLVMATNAEFPPYEYREGDSIVGIDAEIAAEVANQLGMELVIEDMAFDSIIAAVSSGKADIGVAGLTVREDRLEFVNFTEPYTQADRKSVV